MRKLPGRSSLLLVFAALAMLAMPMEVGAAPAKKAPAAAKTTKVNKARSQAAKKGWETRRMNQKAESNWASRIAKDPKADKPGAKDAFMKRSVASQRTWQKRKASATSSKKVSKNKAGKNKAGKNKAGKIKASKKEAADKNKAANKNQAAGKKLAGKKSGGKKGQASPADPEDAIQSSVGAADFKTGLAKFDEARFALSEGRNMDAAEAQMHGHDAMAQAAYDTADEYEAAGRVDEATNLRAFGDGHLAKADAMEQAIDQAQAQARPRRGRVGRFFHWINPFKKRGGDQQVAVAGE